MIIPMYKYDILVFHKEYKNFLNDLQNLGILHIEAKKHEASDEIKEKYAQLAEFENALQLLEKREVHTSENISKELDGLKISNAIKTKITELDQLTEQLDEIKKELQKAKPWGNFSPGKIKNLADSEIFLKLFIATKKQFSELIKEGYSLEIVSEQGNQLFLVFIQTPGKNAPANIEEIEFPALPYDLLLDEQKIIETKIAAINKTFDSHAAKSLPVLEESKRELIKSIDFESVLSNTSSEAEETLMKLEGWIPETKKAKLDDFLNNSEAVFFSRKAKPSDKIPVLLKNNWFSKLFEPIGKMFSLPDYNELDLTTFFAPFFMLFFGFCLGDAGYGILFIVGAGLYKFKASKSAKPYLTLIQFLGLATVIFGTISGTFFGINLIETNIQWLEEFKSLFLNPDKMFNLALILGGIQIIFGLFIKAANQTKQFGFSYALATIGWLIILLGTVTYFILTGTNVLPKNSLILTIILATGAFFILFFSDPGINIFSRIGKGIWDIYSTVTGIFGDLLSYIRLFALGLSSAILGFVINDIAVQILSSSKIIGPVFFVIFLLLGHTLNILISSLGSFVHPMRLTFVEFYKNAGFKGGGEEYKPFSN